MYVRAALVVEKVTKKSIKLFYREDKSVTVLLPSLAFPFEFPATPYDKENTGFMLDTTLKVDEATGLFYQQRVGTNSLYLVKETVNFHATGIYLAQTASGQSALNEAKSIKLSRNERGISDLLDQYCQNWVGALIHPGTISGTLMQISKTKPELAVIEQDGILLVIPKRFLVNQDFDEKYVKPTFDSGS